MRNKAILLCAIVAPLLAFVLSGCFGNVTQGSSVWTVTAPGSVLYSSPSTRTLILTLRHNGDLSIEYFLQVSVTGSIPAGWTVTPPASPIQLGGVIGATEDAEIQVVVPAGVAPGNKTLHFQVEQVGGPGSSAPVDVEVIVQIGTTTTNIREVLPFDENGSSIFESLLEISWGENTTWSTLMATRPSNFDQTLTPGIPKDALCWFKPKSGGISLDPGDVDNVTAVILPTTNKVARTYKMRNYFNHLTNEYGIDQSVTVPAATAVSYELLNVDPWMGLKMSDGDKTVTYSIEFEQVGGSGIPGQYSFNLLNLSSQFTGIVNPVTANVSGFGDKIVVNITITRVADGPIEDTLTCTLRGVHDNNPNRNVNVQIPIVAFLGRP